MIFRPVFMTEEEMEKAIPEEFFGDFRNTVDDYRARIDMVEEAAKVYILRNWKKIEDWTDFSGTLEAGGGDQRTQTYYKYVESPFRKGDSEVVNRFFQDYENDKKKKQYVLREVNEVVLDPSDGDFSITVNGDEEFLWLENGIIELADYIEKQLKGEEK